ncbi:hypothetical protein PLIIFM63780_002268 [Purpureocillium lilacinum]|uniref:uncharacterized protein n=1 Tax=Purpureocillium lilacinum TaxID=33203 RepID=UPI00207E34EF|nr:hypothetical protein PLICBS_010115 [Purpureocillium lilacinum]GJN78759.1 hypothetical protein PLIIFM63780_002268 [Purpureocillium lilacinum]
MNATGLNSTDHIGVLPFTPVYAPNAFFLSIFTILLVVQLILTYFFWRSYGYAIGMLGGLLLELLGYAAKLMLSQDRKNKNGYIMYIIGLTLGPTFLSASLYLGLKTLQQHYNFARFWYIGPKVFAALFILGDFISLAFIGVGGSLAAIYAEDPIGVNLMIAGLATQVLFTTIFGGVLATIFRKTRWKLRHDKTRFFMLGGLVAAICLLIRSIWRVFELSEGFNGPLTSKEGVFIALDSIPMVIMSVLITTLHPRLWFHENQHSISRVKDGFWIVCRV